MQPSHLVNSAFDKGDTDFSELPWTNFDSSDSAEGGADPHVQSSGPSSPAHINHDQYVTTSHYEVPPIGYTQPGCDLNRWDSAVIPNSSFGYAPLENYHGPTDGRYVQGYHQCREVDARIDSSYEASLLTFFPSDVNVGQNFEIRNGPYGSEPPPLDLQPNSAQNFRPAYAPHSVHPPLLSN